MGGPADPADPPEKAAVYLESPDPQGSFGTRAGDIRAGCCLKDNSVATPTPEMSDSKNITVQVGYLAMVSFLEELFSKFEFDQLGGILGGLRPLADGTPADPGMWSDWMRAVDLARRVPPVSPNSDS